MVDGPDSMEAHVHPEGSIETNSEIVMQRDEATPQQVISPTTTISTIAVQSEETRVVIALLQVRNTSQSIIIYIFYCYIYSCSLSSTFN